MRFLIIWAIENICKYYKNIHLFLEVFRISVLLCFLYYYTIICYYFFLVATYILVINFKQALH